MIIRGGWWVDFRPVLQIGQISQSCLQEEKFHAEQLFSVAVFVLLDSFFFWRYVRGDYFNYVFVLFFVGGKAG
jgi:hypothetical protein